jgi:hypothetical protein
MIAVIATSSVINLSQRHFLSTGSSVMNSIALLRPRSNLGEQIIEISVFSSCQIYGRCHRYISFLRRSSYHHRSIITNHHNHHHHHHHLQPYNDQSSLLTKPSVMRRVLAMSALAIAATTVVQLLAVEIELSTNLGRAEHLPRLFSSLRRIDD